MNTTLLNLDPLKVIQLGERVDVLRLEPKGLGAVCDLTPHETQQLADTLRVWAGELAPLSGHEALLNRAILQEKEAFSFRAACRNRSGPWHYVGNLLDRLVDQAGVVQDVARVAFHHDRYKALAEGKEES